METNIDGTYFQEGDHVRIKRSGEIGRINAADGGVVYVLMDKTNETKLFSAYVDNSFHLPFVSPLSRRAARTTCWPCRLK